MSSSLKIIFCSVLTTLFLSNLNAQSKKEQIEILNNKIDSIEKVKNQIESELQIRKSEIESLQNRIQLEQEKNKKSLSENASINEKLKSERDGYLREAAVLRGFEQKNKELIDRIEAYTSVILSDSLSLKFLCEQRVPKHTHLLSALIHDVNNDKYDDFLVFFQDTINFEKDNMTEMYLSPVIFEIQIYNPINKSLEVRFHCTGLFEVWNAPWSEDFYIEAGGNALSKVNKNQIKNSSDARVIITHYGLWNSHVSEQMEFIYNSQTRDFSLIYLEYSYLHRLSPDHGGYSLDFNKKKYEGRDKKLKTIDFAPPTLSAWPNGSWRDVQKIRDLE
jgi:hypothetical protein